VTHEEKDCAFWLRNHTSLGKKDQGYGAWMKAGVERPNRKVEIHVEGRATQFGRETKKPSKEGQQKPVPPTTKNADFIGTNLETLDPSLGSDTQSIHMEFEGQLREINEELGLIYENFGIANVKVSKSNSRDNFVDSITPRGPHPQKSPNDKGPLKDVTNIPKTGMGSWKKKARASWLATSGSLMVLAEKRSSEYITEACEDYGRPGKYPRTTPIEIVLAEVDHAQPRQTK
jgi:hypothetical protein